jgi:protein-tyrosine sulfotransferase
MQMGKTLTKEEIKAIGLMPINFILAKERSGTTLLQAMLNANPHIVAPPESRFIVLLSFKYSKITVWTEKIICKFSDDLFKEGLFRFFWGITKKELRATLFASKDLLTFPLICKIIFYLSSPEKKEVSIFIDKNPIYYFFQPELNKIFPEAKYIHLVRDYRAYLISYHKMFANTKRAYTVKKSTEIVYRWMKVNMLIEEAKKRSPKNYFTLTYEFLVNNPAQSMQEVCGFLNLPYDENMVQNHQSGIYLQFKGIKKERFRKVHENVFQPINPSLTDDWKGKISEKELISIEAVAGKYAEVIYGYKNTLPVEVVKSNPTTLFMLNLKYKVIRILYRKVFAHTWIYYIIKKNLWRNF